MHTNILYIQFRENTNAETAEQHSAREKLRDAQAEITFVNAVRDTSVEWDRPDEVLDGYHGVILGGSGEFYFDGGRDEADPFRARIVDTAERMKPFVRHLFEQEVPTLAICLGHQLIAHALGARVKHCTVEGKTGTYEVTRSEAGEHDPLFADLPKCFDAQYGHKDIVDSLFDGAVILATGDKCRYSALRYGSCVYAVQFHPELSLKDLEARIAEHPEYLPEGVSTADLFRETPHATQVLVNFATFAQSRRA